MLYTWEEFFELEAQKDYYKKLQSFILEEYQKYKVYPPYNLVFNAFKLTPFDKVKVVILGQDPYHNPHQAMGLAFSVPDGVKVPPSLANIYKELGMEYNTTIDQNGDLTYLAKQGVLLLNALLTVRENQPMSHKGVGYEILLENIIKKLNEDNTPKVFILWGGPAKKMMKYLNNPLHLILTSAHPSPLSAYNGFFGNNHFIKTNEYLLKNNRSPIDWIKKEADVIRLF